MRLSRAEGPRETGGCSVVGTVTLLPGRLLAGHLPRVFATERLEAGGHDLAGRDAPLGLVPVHGLGQGRERLVLVGGKAALQPARHCLSGLYPAARLQRVQSGLADLHGVSFIVGTTSVGQRDHAVYLDSYSDCSTLEA